MTGLSTPALPVSLLKPPSLPGANSATLKGKDEATTRAQIDARAKEYEQTFLSIMMSQMFKGTSRTLFGGGEGEEAFTGFLTDAMAKQMAQRGGIGLAKSLSAEMLKLQGLAANPSADATATPAKPSSPAPASSAAPTPTLDIAA